MASLGGESSGLCLCALSFRERGATGGGDAIGVARWATWPLGLKPFAFNERALIEPCENWIETAGLQSRGAGNLQPVAPLASRDRENVEDCERLC